LVRHSTHAHTNTHSNSADNKPATRRLIAPPPQCPAIELGTTPVLSYFPFPRLLLSSIRIPHRADPPEKHPAPDRPHSSLVHSHSRYALWPDLRSAAPDPRVGLDLLLQHRPNRTRRRTR